MTSKIQLACLATAMALTSCVSEDINYGTRENAQYGFLNLNATTNQQVKVEATRAASVLPTTDEKYKLTLTNSASGATTWGPITYKAFSEDNTKSILVAKTGYTLTVENCTDSEAINGNGQLHVKGAADFTITAGQTTDVTVNASVVNAKSTFVANAIDGITINGLTIAENKTTNPRTFENVYVASADHATATAYFFNINEDTTEELKYTLKYTLSGDTEQKTFTGTLDLKKATWSKYTFSITTDNGKLGLTINVNEDLAEEDQSVTVNPLS